MKIRTMTKQNDVPFFEIENTNLTPAEITLHFEGFEEGITQYVRISLSDGDTINEYEVDSVIYALVNALQNKNEYIISVGDTTARKEISDATNIKEIAEWIEA